MDRRRPKRKASCIDDGFLNESVLDKFLPARSTSPTTTGNNKLDTSSSTPEQDSFLEQSFIDQIAIPKAKTSLSIRDESDTINDFLHEPLSAIIGIPKNATTVDANHDTWIQRRRKEVHPSHPRRSDNDEISTSQKYKVTRGSTREPRQEPCKEANKVVTHNNNNWANRKSNFLNNKTNKIDNLTKDREHCKLVERLKAELEPHVSSLKQIVQGMLHCKLQCALKLVRQEDIRKGATL